MNYESGISNFLSLWKSDFSNELCQKQSSMCLSKKEVQLRPKILTSLPFKFVANFALAEAPMKTNINVYSAIAALYLLIGYVSS